MKGKSTPRILLCALILPLLLIGSVAYAQLAGTYTINAGGTATATNYLTVTAAVSDLMSGTRADGGPVNGPGVTGPVTLRIVAGSGPYTEQITIGAITGTSSTNFVRLTGGPTREEINFAAATTGDRQVIKLSGANHTILDSLTLVNNSTSFGFGVHITNNSDSNWVTNSNITVINTSTSSNFAGIAITGTTATSAGNNGDYNTIQGNVVSGGYYGISCQGTSTTVYSEKNNIINNEFREFYFYGIRHYSQNNGVISGNIVHARATGTSSAYGMYIYYNNNYTIERNRIYDVGTYGIYTFTSNFQGPGSGGRSSIRNNMIGGTSLNTGAHYGIYMTTNTTNVDVFHNSISLTSSSSTARCIYILSGSGNDIRNNSFSIINAPTGYAAYVSSAASVSTMNYNNYYAPGSSNFIYVGTAYTPGTYQGGGGFNVNSTDGNPNYVDPFSDLHAFGAQLFDKGDPTVNVTNDYDGQVRPNPASTIPDIGADEYLPNNIDITVTQILDPANNICPDSFQMVRAVIKNNGLNTISSVPLTAEITGAGTATLTTTHTNPMPLNAIDTVMIGMFNTWPGGTFNVKVYSAVAGDQDMSNDTLMVARVVNTTPAPPTAADTTICSGGSAQLVASSTGNNYWFDAAAGGTLLASNDTLNTGALTATSNYYVEARGQVTSSLATTYANNNSCGGGNMINITAIADVTIDSFYLHLQNTGSVSTTDVYYRVGGYAGFETNAGAWTLLGSASVTSLGVGTPTPCPIGGLTIPAGQTYGIYIYNPNVVYTTLSSITTYSSPEMNIIAGVGLCGLFSGTNSPRGWNGTVFYQAEGCASQRTMVTVTVENPSATGSVVQPSTCVSSDGSIDITVTGATGPFTYAWTGPGVIPTNEDQVNLTVGNYSVTVTSAAGCMGTANFSLSGPGGCFVCPTIGSYTSSPANAACDGTTETLTASGLTDMGTTYGITFKRSATALADPYVGGTVIATIPNGGLGGGGTMATTTTVLPIGSHFMYAILSPTPIDPFCRPAQQFNFDVNPIPTVDPMANDTVCASSLVTKIFTGTVPGTVYNWTNSNTAIGLPASGMGNLNFTATNATAAPISGTITVTPTYTNAGVTCTGTNTSFVITVNPAGQVNPVPNQTVCKGQPTAPVNFTSTVPGTVFSWTNDNTSIGLAAQGQGNIASFIAQNTTTVQQVATITVTPSYGTGGIIQTQTFNYTGAVQTWVVPAGVTSVDIKAWGAQGNSNALGVLGGLGGYAEGTLAVTPGQTLYINAGGGGQTAITGGFNGGGNAGTSGCATAQGGGGGGASDVRVSANTLAARAIVAAGGGGAGGNRVSGCGRGTGGGGGGGYYGGGGAAAWPFASTVLPTGGTQTAGGTAGTSTYTGAPGNNGTAGALGVGGTGGNEVSSNQGGSAAALPGGVGGGLTGANGAYSANWTGQSGAGGSSYIGGVAAGVTTAGLNSGNGRVEFTYMAGGISCPGATQTFTITVNPNPSLVIIADPGTTICEGDPTLLTVYNGTGGTSTIPLPPQNATFSGNVRGYWFTAPNNFTMTAVRVPTDASSGNQSIAIVRFNGATPPPAFPGTTNAFTTLFLTQNNPATGAIPVNIPIAAGEVIGVMGYRATTNSYSSNGPQTTTINGSPVTLTRMGMQFPLTTTAPQNIWQEAAFPISRVEFSYSTITTGGIATGTFLWSPAAGLSSTTSNPVAASPMNTTTYTVVRTTVPGGCIDSASITITVNKRPVVTSSPANSVNCSGTTATFTVAGTGTNLGYQWQVSTTGTGGPWTDLTNTAPYSGVTTPTLTVDPVTVAMNGYAYRCVLTGTCAPGSPPMNVSGAAVLTVNPLPNVTVTPATGCGGVAGINGLALTASGANSYVWTPNGAGSGLYSNATATTVYTGTNLATVYAAPSAFTVYTVTGTNTTTGCINTATARINYTPPAPTVTPSSVTMCLGDPAVRLTSASSSTSTATFTSGTISVPIPEGSFPTGPYNAGVSTIPVSGIPAGANISRINVRMNITHGYVGDVVAVLKAPNGQIINLDALLNYTNNAGANFVNTVISSAGTTPLSAGSAPWTNTYRADLAGATFTVFGFTIPGGPIGYIPTSQAWSSLYSVPNGNWTLALYDAGAPDVGTLTNWSMDITYVQGVPATPAVWTPAAGLFNDAAASSPYVAGTAQDTVWTRPTPSGVYNYQATVMSLSSPPGEIQTTFTNNNQFGLVVFNFKNNNPYPVNITGIESIASSSGPSIATLYYKTSAIAGPPGAITAANGWNTAGTGPYTAIGNTTTTTPQQFLSGLSLTIPAGATYGLAVESRTSGGTGNLRYSTLGAGVQTISSGGCDLITGTNVGYAGNIAPNAPTFTPRGFIGKVKFGLDTGAPCTSPARTVVVTVNQPTTLNPALPVNQTICTDKVATFSVAVTAGTGPHNYQWQVSTNSGNTFTNITNGGVYSGATSATLTITAPPVSMSGNYYRCVVTGAAPCASVTSLQRLLTVNPLPTVVIAANPYTSLMPGMTTTLSSTVSPNAAATYTWIRNGVTVAGATAATLGVDVDGLGNYQLRVTDVNGCTNSSNIVTIKDSASGRCFLYPNPTNGMFQVRYYSVANNVVPRGIVIYDAKGDRVLVQNYSIGRPYDRMDVDMRAYGKGLYWVEVVDRNGSRLTMCRVVIQ